MKSLALAEQVMLRVIDEFITERIDFLPFWGRLREVLLDESPPAIRANRFTFFRTVHANAEEIDDLIERGNTDEAEIRMADFRNWLKLARDAYREAEPQN